MCAYYEVRPCERQYGKFDVIAIKVFLLLVHLTVVGGRRNGPHPHSPDPRLN